MFLVDEFVNAGETCSSFIATCDHRRGRTQAVAEGGRARVRRSQPLLDSVSHATTSPAVLAWHGSCTSRPSRSDVARPASTSAWRCFTTAWPRESRVLARTSRGVRARLASGAGTTPGVSDRTCPEQLVERAHRTKRRHRARPQRQRAQLPAEAVALACACAPAPSRVSVIVEHGCRRRRWSRSLNADVDAGASSSSSYERPAPPFVDALHRRRRERRRRRRRCRCPRAAHRRPPSRRAKRSSARDRRSASHSTSAEVSRSI